MFYLDYMPFIIFFILQIFLLSGTFSKNKVRSKRLKKIAPKRVTSVSISEKAPSVIMANTSDHKAFSKLSELETGEPEPSFMGFLFSKYGIQYVNEVLQKKGKELEVIENLNSNKTGSMIAIPVQIGDKWYKIYCDIDAIQTRVKYENRAHINEKSIGEALQYLINNIGLLTPFIIESARYEWKKFIITQHETYKKKDNLDEIIDNKNLSFEIQSNDKSNEVYNDDYYQKQDEFLSYNVLFTNQLQESILYIIFDSCLASFDVFDKILTIILYRINKNKNNKDGFVKKNFISKMIDYAINLYRYNNIFVIQDNIYEELNKFNELDNLYKINNIVLLILLYRIAHFPIIEKKFLLKNLSTNQYFLYLLKQSYAYKFMNQLEEDGNFSSNDHEIKKSKLIFENIKMFFMLE